MLTTACHEQDEVITFLLYLHTYTKDVSPAGPKIFLLIYVNKLFRMPS